MQVIQTKLKLLDRHKKSYRVVQISIKDEQGLLSIPSSCEVFGFSHISSKWTIRSFIRGLKAGNSPISRRRITSLYYNLKWFPIQGRTGAYISWLVLSHCNAIQKLQWLIKKKNYEPFLYMNVRSDFFIGRFFKSRCEMNIHFPLRTSNVDESINRASFLKRVEQKDGKNCSCIKLYDCNRKQIWKIAV